ncbi:hypothetical protein [Undibacterium sp. TS12]|uniref:hypothetical protein n=1 Tax=Undibacterium sp. TS12 TaxID=2908202 RepID=UPI001F4C8592|nr:hypothetical protein [Undibacterium sp. TS12]MCH8620258.1 hypothetical protein [Undibacterium sp. TS12]
MSTNFDQLFLQSINRSDEIGGMMYHFLLNGEVLSFVAHAKDFSGIRSVEFSEEFDGFLRPFLTKDPGIVKKLVGITWSFIDGATLALPIMLS